MSDEIEPTVDAIEDPVDGSGSDPTKDAPADVVRTGNVPVDEVLDSLDGLDDLPVDEHVAVYEKAHEQLRGALDA